MLDPHDPRLTSLPGNPGLAGPFQRSVLSNSSRKHCIDATLQGQKIAGTRETQGEQEGKPGISRVGGDKENP